MTKWADERFKRPFSRIPKESRALRTRALSPIATANARIPSDPALPQPARPRYSFLAQPFTCHGTSGVGLRRSERGLSAVFCGSEIQAVVIVPWRRRGMETRPRLRQNMKMAGNTTSTISSAETTTPMPSCSRLVRRPRRLLPDIRHTREIQFNVQRSLLYSSRNRCSQSFTS